MDNVEIDGCRKTLSRKVPGESRSKEQLDKKCMKSHEIKSKRRRCENSDSKPSSKADSDLQHLLAKQLSEFLDSTIEEVVIDNEDYDHSIEVEKQADDFQLFSTKLRASCNLTGSSALQMNSKVGNKNERPDDSSTSEDEDGDTYARLKEAAVTVQDIFGSAFETDGKVQSESSN